MAGRVTLWNRAAEQIFGWSADEALGRFPPNIPEDQRDGWWHTFREAAKGTPLPAVEYERRRKDGRRIVINAWVAPLRDAKGGLRGLFGIAEDVTDQKRIVNDLQRRLRQQQAVAELAAAALQERDLGALYARGLETVSAVLGTEFAAVLAWDGEGLVLRAGVGWPPALVDAAPVEAGPRSQAIHALRADESTVIDDLRTETRFEIPDFLRTRAVLSRACTPIRGRAASFGVLAAASATQHAFDRYDIQFLETVAFVLGTSITRTEDEAMLLAERARQAAIFENTVDGLIIADTGGVIEEANPAAERMFGFDRGALGGQPLETLMPEPYHSEHAGYIGAYLETNEARIIGKGREVVGRRRDGTTFPIDLGVAEFHTRHDGRHFIGTLRDISERKEFEERLRQAHKMEAVGQLTGGIAHDFNNLLTVIVGSGGLLAEELNGTPLSSLTEMILTAGRRGAELTHRLLAFSRQQLLQPAVLDLNRLVDEMNHLLHRTLGENIEIVTVLAPDLWPALADPSQIENALLNLAVNGRDAMADGGTLVIETANVVLDDDYARANADVRPGAYVMLSVADMGTGMSAETASKAFDPFFTTKEIGKGSGLGLSMVYGFTKQSGGHAKIYSELGEGTVVKLYLPRAGIPAPAAGAPDRSAEALPRGGETVLVVEDDLLVRQHLGTLLRGLGYQVIEAANGPEALAVASATAFDLLFTDIIMPGGMNGRDLAERILRIRPGARVLFTSGYPEDILANRGKPTDGFPFLRKPYERAEVARTVRHVLDGADPRAR